MSHPPLAEDSPLPAILCLHGYGTNAAILRYQLRHITRSLSPTFRFIFPEGPFHVANPGPGALPTFADARPFRRWHADPTLAGIFGVTPQTLTEERKAVRKLLSDTIEHETANGSNVVGVMAFSQGAGLATALCLDKELGRGVKFAVIICALYPAVSIAEDEEGKLERIVIPSIHVQGKTDSWRGQGMKVLEEYYLREKVRLIELGMGHEVSGKIKDVAVVVEAVREVWEGARRD